MPEGPEIRRVTDAMQKHIASRQIDSIRFGLESLKQWETCLAGAKVIKIESYGKALVTRLDKIMRWIILWLIVCYCLDSFFVFKG